MYVIANFSTEGGLTKAKEAVAFLVGKEIFYPTRSVANKVAIGARRGTQDSSWFRELFGLQVC